jgi:ATP-binding cassette, subfamily B, bacterial
MKLEWLDAVKPLSAILTEYWRQSKWTLISVTAIAILGSLLSVGAPYVFSKLIDRLPVDPNAQTIIGGFVFYAILLGLATILNHTVDYLTLLTSENLNFISGVAFFERILTKSSDFFIDHNPAEIESARSRGQTALNGFVQMALGVIAPSMGQFTLTILMLGAALSMQLALIVTTYGVLFIGFTYLANRWSNKHLDDAIESTQTNARFVGNAVNAMETLRLFGCDPWLRKRFSEEAQEIRDSWRRFCLKRISYSVFYGAMLALQFSITFTLLLPKYRTGEASIGDIVLFNTLLLQLNQPFEMVGHAIDNIVRSYSQFIPFAKMWTAPDYNDDDRPIALPASEGRIEFENVHYHYQNGRGIEDISFNAERGRITFLTGETGSGKSTIFRLLLKSASPTKGRILVDGTDLNRIGRAQWFSKIGVVPQDCVLLNETLHANIILGREADEEKLRKAASRAAILELIEKLPLGFDTLVGERGLKLSGGERQRIAIARALYAEPEFLFLDEASSSLDDKTEHDIFAEVRNITDDVTILAITHRKASIEPQDHIISLKTRVPRDG